MNTPAMRRLVLSLFVFFGLARLGGLIASPRLPAQSSDSGSSAAAMPAAVPCGPASAVSSDEPGHGFDLSNLDRTVSSCDDFYQFADGGWMKNNPIPAAYSSWGTFNKLQDHNQEVLHRILEEAAKDKSAKPGSSWQKIGDFYASCMDEAQVEAAGIKPLEPEFRRIASIASVSDFEREVARLQQEGVDALFAFGSEQDYKDSAREIAVAAQGGLGLPDRDYYFKEDEKSKQLRDAYVQHVTNLFTLLGDSEATASVEAKTVLAIETTLARASMTRVDRRDPDKTYHLMAVADLEALTPDFSWPDYFHEVGTPPVTSLNIRQPDFFKQVEDLLLLVPLDDWKIYLRWHLIHAAAPALSSKFVNEDFSFYGRKLTGAEELLPRWKRCVRATDGELGEALGQFYVERAFPPEAKARALDMVRHVIAALRDDLTTLDWMSPPTREQAIRKLEAIQLKIGYPEKWRDYSAFRIERGPYVENVLRGDSFEFARRLAKIGRPVDRTEWGMTPPTVNAYYNASMNEIVFPAGILQPPFYDPRRDDALNYGGIGTVIGHELTHGFDDQGSKFDAQGNLRNWWTPEDLKNFQARGECIAKQFDGFEVEPGLHENGKLVEGESIADLGGLTIALAAFEKSLQGKPAPAPIDGFTAEQRFFLAWAQTWASNIRPEYARLIVNTNPHPLGRFRADGPLSNMPPFAKAWNCRADSKMVRPEAQRCRIW